MVRARRPLLCALAPVASRRLVDIAAAPSALSPPARSRATLRLGGLAPRVLRRAAAGKAAAAPHLVERRCNVPVAGV